MRHALREGRSRHGVEPARLRRDPDCAARRRPPLGLHRARSDPRAMPRPEPDRRARTRRRRALATGLLALALGFVAPSRAQASDELVVAAAASLREAFGELARAFEAAGGPRVQLAFGASSALAQQIRAGAPIDVLAAADLESVEALEAAGLARPANRTLFASNRLVLVATPESVASLRRPEDLRGPAVRRFAVPDEAVPAGHYAREWLRARGLLDALAPRLLRTEDVRAALAAVDLGNADAALVYATDARLARTARVAFGVPADEGPRIVYAATQVAGSRRPEAARRFLDFLRGETASRLLQAQGFRPPP